MLNHENSLKDQQSRLATIGFLTNARDCHWNLGVLWRTGTGACEWQRGFRKDAGLGEVSVVFFPMDSKARTAMTMTLTDGTFSLDVFPGQYGLGFSRMRGGKTLQNFMSPASQQTQEYKDMVKEGKGGIPPKNTLPEKYIDAKTSGFEMTVQPRVQPAVQFKLPVAE